MTISRHRGCFTVSFAGTEGIMPAGPLDDFRRPVTEFGLGCACPIEGGRVISCITILYLVITIWCGILHRCIWRKLYASSSVSFACRQLACDDVLSCSLWRSGRSLCLDKNRGKYLATDQFWKFLPCHTVPLIAVPQIKLR